MAEMNPDQYIFVVMGTTGEYSDRTEWPVIATTDEGAAQQYVDALGEQFRATKSDENNGRWTHEDALKAAMTLDPNFNWDEHTGTSWCIMKVKMMDSKGPIPGRMLAEMAIWNIGQDLKVLKKLAECLTGADRKEIASLARNLAKLGTKDKK